LLGGHPDSIGMAPQLAHESHIRDTDDTGSLADFILNAGQQALWTVYLADNPLIYAPLISQVN